MDTISNKQRLAIEIVSITLGVIVVSFIVICFVIGLRKAKSIPKYLILFLLAFICPPLCVFIIRDQIKPGSCLKVMFRILTCDYCCGFCNPNAVINLILTTCYIPGVLHSLYLLFSVLDDI
ncbi:hypothetical protein RhiirA5_406241 [Rhizophagus irregularis]|uniref:Uncharacterized protein n=2 Tax=Rhizophagus irregularis TaxID=588596 RepID=A0A2N0S852_9GLOM|nr:hypothetical protein RhiirA5_406241 [Rhizophagus irregularis]GBC44186.1 hypothetical protein RIR_jg15277.t1 [Rhizophagus irregularis DAOM 181602=DAOM 197198]PKC71750.1 hypothetical protein RhiirA1_453165 [Rhizophagus irregularis]UZO22308.1 hypothetical protein OCT59_014672 [Rhizophagus irregularis]CAB4490524.1 unnamed protein product [Rhizophagus irregularis]